MADTTTTSANDVVLEARNIVKHFGGIAALDGVNFDLRRGEVHAVVGDNGAGKSTHERDPRRNPPRSGRGSARRTRNHDLESVIMISHKLPEVFAVAHRTTVMRLGKSVATLDTKETSLEAVVGLITGATNSAAALA